MSEKAPEYKPIHTPIYTQPQLDTAIEQARLAERERCAEAVPTNWLDPLLTGPNAVAGNPPFGCPEIERLLRAVKQRITTLEARKESADTPSKDQE